MKKEGGKEGREEGREGGSKGGRNTREKKRKEKRKRESSDYPGCRLLLAHTPGIPPTCYFAALVVSC